MTHYSGLCISDQKWIKTRMKTSIHPNSKGNEIIACYSFGIRSSLFLSSHCHYMCYHHSCSVHHIYANWVENDNVHQSTKIVYGNKNIHSSSGVVREKVGEVPLNMCFAFQHNNYNSTPKCVVGCILILIGPLKQMGT
jgi:hypothetical protein